MFSATKANERALLGEQVTAWLEAQPQLQVVDTVIKQSSDQQFHCLTLVIFYRHADR